MMKLNMEYDPKTNTTFAKKLIGKTDYYVGLTKVCANCGKAIAGYPALSRKDNKTEICSNCGTLEALEDFEKYENENNTEKILEQFNLLDFDNEKQVINFIHTMPTEIYNGKNTDGEIIILSTRKDVGFRLSTFQDNGYIHILEYEIQKDSFGKEELIIEESFEHE